MHSTNLEQLLEAARWTARQFSVPGHETEDLEQQAILAVLEELQKKPRLTKAYVKLMIRHKLLDLKRRECFLGMVLENDPDDIYETEEDEQTTKPVKRYAGVLSLDTMICTDEEGGEVPLRDRIEDSRPNPEDLYIAEESARQVHARLQALPELHREVVSRRVGLYDEAPSTFRAIAEELGISNDKAERTYHSAIETLRTEVAA